MAINKIKIGNEEHELQTTIANVDGLQAALDGKASSSHSHTITASASDDDVVVLTGTNGTNQVTYSASHANSGVTAGTYKSVTVNAKGHVTGGTNPTTLAGYGITDALKSNTTYALSDAVGGAAMKMKVTRPSVSVLDAAAAMSSETEEVYFFGSDGTSKKAPVNYCIINAKRGTGERTILDCYDLQTGNHYINGNMTVSNATTWTGWVLQPNQASLDTILSSAKSYTDSKAVTVDSSLSASSANPVQNKVITNWLAENVKNYRLAVSGSGNSTNNYLYLTSEAVDVAASAPSDASVVYTFNTVGGDSYFGVLWENIQYIPTVNGKSLSSSIILSASDVDAYSKTEIDNLELITVGDIDAICGTTIQVASAEGVTF